MRLDLLEVLDRAVQECHADVCGLERTNVVGAVTGHEGRVSKAVECRKDGLLLGGRHASVDESMLNELVERGRTRGVEGESSTSDADVVLGEELLVELGVGVYGNNLALIDSTPGEICVQVLASL